MNVFRKNVHSGEIAKGEWEYERKRKSDKKMRQAKGRIIKNQNQENYTQGRSVRETCLIRFLRYPIKRCIEGLIMARVPSPSYSHPTKY